jgi:hypothetical protein
MIRHFNSTQDQDDWEGDDGESDEAELELLPPTMVQAGADIRDFFVTSSS